MASSAPDTLTPRAREVVDAARELLEAEGLEALSMRRLGEHLGIRAPSIYKHLPDKQALENALISAGFEEQADAFEAALRGADDPLGALATAYRAFAAEHPHLYRLMTERPLDRENLAPGAEERAGRDGSRSGRRRRRPRPRRLGLRPRHDRPRAQRPVPSRRRSRLGLGPRDRRVPVAGEATALNEVAASGR